MHEREQQPDKHREAVARRNVQRTRRAPDTGLTGPLTPDALTDLQQLAGNRVVSAIVGRQRGSAVQRVTDEGAGSVSGASEGAASRMTPPEASEVSGPGEEQEAPRITQPEAALLHQYRQQTQNSQVQALLDELLPLLDRVGYLYEGRSGGNTVRQGSDQSGRRYLTTYGAGDEEDRIARLVHELTHVRVDVVYDSDMMNYPAPPLSGQVTGSEDERQRMRYRQIPRSDIDRFQLHVMHNVTELLRLLPYSGLPGDVRKAAFEKIRLHLGSNPHKEYDGVLSHLLT